MDLIIKPVPWVCKAYRGAALVCVLSLTSRLWFPHTHGAGTAPLTWDHRRPPVLALCLLGLPQLHRCPAPSSRSCLPFKMQLRSHVICETTSDLFFLTGRINHSFSV